MGREDGSWSLPGGEWAEEAFKTIFLDSYRGPADGPFGPRQLADLADEVGGTVHLVPREPIDDDDVLIY